jgi:NADPH:quinone reductase-like Zn-dependent oxidoreductase
VTTANGSMHAVYLRKSGPPESLKLEECPTPNVGPHDVLIQVRTAGVNFTDVLSRQGLNPEAPKPPYILGHETAGEIIRVGENVAGLREGQRVLAFHSNGGYAEKVAVPAGQVFPIPDSIPFQSAVLLPLNYGTAYIALHRTGPVEPGMRVFIHAAAGGVGMAAVDLARRAGLEIVAAASTHFKRSRLIAEGVKHVVPSSRMRVHKLSKRLFGGPAFDIVLDSIGGRSIADGLRALKPGGRVVSTGVGQISNRGILGAIAFFLRAPRLTYLDLLAPSRGLYGVNLKRLMEDTALARRVLETLVAWAAAGEIEPAPGRVMALAEAGLAHRILESRGNVGKIVLRV